MGLVVAQRSKGLLAGLTDDFRLLGSLLGIRHGQSTCYYEGKRLMGAGQWMVGGTWAVRALGFVIFAQSHCVLCPRMLL